MQSFPRFPGTSASAKLLTRGRRDSFHVSICREAAIDRIGRMAKKKMTKKAAE
jgi:hypothetical protein